jgi:hypothetical protein
VSKLSSAKGGVHSFNERRARRERSSSYSNSLSHSSRSRTPSIRTPLSRQFNITGQHRPRTPVASGSMSTAIPHQLTPRPRLKRANSHGSGPVLTATWTGVGPVPKSAKRWARSAHLHEVRTTGGKLRKERENRAGMGDPSALGGDDSLGMSPRHHQHAQSLGSPSEVSSSELVDVFASPTAPSRSRGVTLDHLTGNIASALGPGSPGGSPESKGKGKDYSHLLLHSAFSPKSEESEGELWVDTDTSVDGDAGGSEAGWSSSGDP